jgi:hypothetical protein
LLRENGLDRGNEGSVEAGGRENGSGREIANLGKGERMLSG